MAQQAVAYGRVPQQMHSLEALKGGEFLLQPALKPTGFVPFQQQQGQRAQTSLSLSSERPVSYNDVRSQHLPHQQGNCGVQLSDFRLANVRAEGSPTLDPERKPFPPNSDGYGTEQTTAPQIQVNRDMELENENAGDTGDKIPEQGDDANTVSTSEFPEQEKYGHLQCYPAASATHDAVVEDPKLFMKTLANFLAALETKLIVPVIGDSEINLHGFYCEVTACGGLVKVIRSGRWKELCDKLLMSKHIINKYYILRKHYMNLLFHYEQVYFFRAEGQLLSAPVPLPAPICLERPVEPSSPYEVPLEIRSLLKKKKRKLDPIQVFGVDPATAVGTTTTGAINGKFDEGYFVTVVVGTEKLSGVLYHFSPRKKAQQFASVPSLLDGIGTEGTTSGLEIQLYGKKKKERIVKADGPKRTRTGYNIYFKEQRARLKELYPDKKGLGKKVIEMWSKLPENEKSYYIALGNAEKERCLTEYNEKMKLKQSQVVDGVNSASGSGPIVDVDHGAYYVSHDYHVSLDVENEVQTGHVSHMTESDQVYHGYHESHSQLMESEVSAGRLVSEQTYEVQDDGDYRQEPVSEDEDGNEAEEVYEAEEDETIYRSADKILEEQEGSEYQASDHEYDLPEEVYPTHTNEPSGHDIRPQNPTSILKHAYYGHEHPYPYVPASVQVEGSQGSARITSMEQSPYQVRDNGQVIYPHVQQGRPDLLVDNAVTQHHLFPRESYGYSHGRPGESLGVPHHQEQGAFPRQDEAGSYMAPLHQNQSMAPKIQTRPEQPYPDRYSYPVHMQHPQMYAHHQPPHGYPRLPHPSYQMQWNDTQTFHHGHGYVPRVHQPQAVVSEVASMRPPSQAYNSQDGGHTYDS